MDGQLIQVIAIGLVIAGVIINRLPWAAKQMTEAMKILKAAAWEIADAQHERAKDAKAVADRQAKRQARQQVKQAIQVLDVFDSGNNGGSKARGLVNSY